ncbi:hypothetical protein SAZ_26200 [Streptomyces noursei ZPM]|uniref:Uncharacterized protein n=1 Tax=Streptomyces noursei TaxID=1971 RepID=A0A401R607_STRNR|nr:hypothetical protein [Streptomyces noursei]AKA08847.1 hypothetical protein SAZ_26200 [Streptomyces noursei ZPM]EPY92812.1 hypothetical protein K530_51290 [Streptomyces noursei CCRC 11814]EXU90285.1 hypothetical protein P354_17695 [Streptomyces noursei PD-1]MCZ0970804.1 hypothetical protein [Streptomyces noursei]UWS73948.1 hypothetical protein N1H47_23505 [Streptomyces noursei]
MTTPTGRTPYQACADAGTQLDDALKAIGIQADPSTVKATEREDGVRLHRVVPPQLTPSQTARVTRHLKGARS